MAKQPSTPPCDDTDFPVEELQPAFASFIDMETLVHTIKKEVHAPRASLVANYNSLVEIRDLIDKFYEDHQW